VDIFEWVKAFEQKAGVRLDLLVIDYADRLGAPGPKARRGDSDYHASRLIYEEFQRWAEATGTCIWTASQARRGAGKKDQPRLSGRYVDLQDVADSMHKVKASDMVITITGEERFGKDGTMEEDGPRKVRLLIAKYRYGEGRKALDPLPTSFETGRLVDTGSAPPVRIGE
jgi:hypothetical protein